MFCGDVFISNTRRIEIVMLIKMDGSYYLAYTRLKFTVPKSNEI